MTWKDILKLDIEGLRRSYSALRGLPDEAIREFDRRYTPMVNVNRLINELKQKYGVGQRLPVPRMVKQDIEAKILAEIKKEGGALGMKNLKQFGEESEIKRVLSKLEKEGKIFMHKDGDIYTHEPKIAKKEEFEPHMMYHPKTGKGFKAKKKADHLRMKEMGYLHENEMGKKK